MGRPVQFSARERQVIDLLLLGKSNKQIALRLGVSVRAIEFHLSNIYSKLGVASRTEAALKLSDLRLRESTGDELRGSAVSRTDEMRDNVSASIFTRRAPVNKSFWLAFGILALTSAFCLISLYGMVKERGDLADSAFTPSMLPTSLPTAATEASLPTVSPKDHTLEQIRELAAEYEQAVQAEKQNGDVEYSRDPATGEEVFRFQGESYTRISSLRNEFHSKLNGLIDLYAQIYRDETNPTPFPSPVSPEQKQSYLNSLYEQGESYCATRDVDAQDATIVFYDPEDGKYYPLLIDDEMARCYVHGWMIEEWRTAPMLAQVDHEADMVMIRVVTGKPNLNLRFQMISELANAPWQSVAVYADETGTRYSVDVESARLAAIEPNLPGHLNIPPGEQKSMDELRGIARQFALTNSPRLNELEAALLYEEHCKQSLCFFRWDYRNRDWTGTDWAMMPPFLQVGVLMSGQVVTYDNTLDLFK